MKRSRSNPTNVPIYTANVNPSIYMSYGFTLYSPDTLKEASKVYAQTLSKMLILDEKIDGLCSTGSSGAILAGAIMMTKLPRPIKLFHINKPEGRGHNGVTSGSYMPYTDCEHLVFVDDFLCTGNSLQRCVDTIAEENCHVTIRYALVAHGRGDEGVVDQNIPIIWAGNRINKYKQVPAG